MTDFDDVVASINAGVYAQWHKLNEASGTLFDESASSHDLSTFRDSGGFTYQVTGSEAADAGTKAISIGGDETPFSQSNGMGSSGDFSAFIAARSQNNGAGGDSRGTLMSIVPVNVTTRQFRFVVNRTADSDGSISVGLFSGASADGTQTYVLGTELVDPWDDDEWHTFGLVQRQDGAGISVYYDGYEPVHSHQTFGTGALDDTFATHGFAASDDFAIGVSANSTRKERIEGHLDNALMWKDYALTEAEMFALMETSQGIVSSTKRRKNRRTFLIKAPV